MWVEQSHNPLLPQTSQASVTYTSRHHQQPGQCHSPKPPPPAAPSSTTWYHSHCVAVLTRVPRRRDAAWERSSPTNMSKSVTPGQRRPRQGRGTAHDGVLKKCASFMTNATDRQACGSPSDLNGSSAVPLHSSFVGKNGETICWLLPGPHLPLVNVSSTAHLLPCSSEVCSLVSPSNLWRSQRFWRSKAQQLVSRYAVLSSRILQP